MDTKELEKWKAKTIEKKDQRHYLLLWAELIFFIFITSQFVLQAFPESRLYVIYKNPWYIRGLVAAFIAFLLFYAWVKSGAGDDKAIEKNELYELYTLKSFRWGFIGTAAAGMLWMILITAEISIPPMMGIGSMLWLGVVTQRVANLIYRSRK